MLCVHGEHRDADSEGDGETRANHDLADCLFIHHCAHFLD
jgi:hypothetical protein